MIFKTQEHWAHVQNTLSGGEERIVLLKLHLASAA
jgi:hypothetical protein